VKEPICEFGLRYADRSGDFGQNAVQCTDLYEIVVWNSQAMSSIWMRGFYPNMTPLLASHLVSEPLKKPTELSSREIPRDPKHK
jgi:hypothetical protein